MSNKDKNQNIVNHKNTNKVQDGIKNAINTADGLTGEGLGLLSQKIAPVIGPIVVIFLWKHKWKFLLAMILGSCFALFSLEAISYQFTANSRSLINEIDAEHRECIEKSQSKYNTEFELVAAFGKVIADFDESHSGQGKGFLEIPNSIWESHGVDGNDNEDITEQDLCDNYFTLTHKLSAIEGDAGAKINEYPYSEKQEVLQWYQLYKGISLIPYGNPIGLDRAELVQVTSGYNLVRVINGVRHTHKGIDLVPSSTWYRENPGKGSTDSINRSIIFGKVTNFKDQYGALCSYVENEKYRTLYCHCDAFIARDQSTVAYGDPICFMGNTGFSTGVHLHLGMYEKRNGTWFVIDPTPFIFPTN